MSEGLPKVGEGCDLLPTVGLDNLRAPGPQQITPKGLTFTVRMTA